MAAQREEFAKGQIKDIDRAKADEIFDLMEKFAQYGFNKSPQRLRVAHIPDGVPQGPS